MTEEKKRIDRAIVRNIHEITKFVNQTNALIKLLEFNRPMGANFFRIVFYALYDDRMSHIIKVLDRNPKSTGFWYIYKFYKREIDKIVKENGMDFKNIGVLSDKLKVLRDGTHFHIDKQGVFDPVLVWKRADITGDFLNETGSNVYNIIKEIYKIHFGEEFCQQSYYKGNDLQIIFKAIEKNDYNFSMDY